MPPEGQRKLYHLEVWNAGKKFDEKTGKQLYKPVHEAMTPQDFKLFNKQAARVGKEFKILWDPTPYL